MRCPVVVGVTRATVLKRIFLAVFIISFLADVPGQFDNDLSEYQTDNDSD